MSETTEMQGAKTMAEYGVKYIAVVEVIKLCLTVFHIRK